jgi:hypothetical protein
VSIKAPREQDLVRPALELLALRGAFAWRNNSGAVAAASNGKRRYIRFGGTPGASDILGILPGGRFIAVELKSKDGRLTAAQRLFLLRVEDLGGLALVVRDLRDLAAALDEEGSCRDHRPTRPPTSAKPRKGGCASQCQSRRSSRPQNEKGRRTASRRAGPATSSAPFCCC